MLHNESYEGEIFIKMCISSLGKLLKEMGELVKYIIYITSYYRDKL